MKCRNTFWVYWLVVGWCWYHRLREVSKQAVGQHNSANAHNLNITHDNRIYAKFGSFP